MIESISKTAKRSSRAGQSMILLAICVVAMLGFLGLVLDGGRIYFEKRRLQAAADAGAFAAAQELRRGFHDADYLRTSTVNDTDLNGYNDDNSTITLNNPPSSGAYSTNSLFAEVTINRVVPTLFMRIMGVTSSTVAARSVAGLIPDPFFCVYALDPTIDGGFTNNGTASFVVNCGIMVNSGSSAAFRGLGTNACTSAKYIGITGGEDIDCSDARQTEPDTGIPSVIDPLNHLIEPDLAAIPVTTQYNDVINGVNTIVYPPGVHAGNHHISGSDVVLFLPGLHVFNNGLTISGGTVSGTGVTFFLPNPTGNKSLDISGGATVNVSAPKTGAYKGMLFWSSRSAPYKPPHNKVARGNAGSTYSGAFYFPNEHFDWGGTPESAAANDAWQLIVARTVSVQGSAASSMMNPPPPDENPILGPVMVE
jgi:Flp pilus assembly protein TadG